MTDAHPFSAVVGQDAGRRGLLCLAVDDALSGALVAAPAGAGKTFLLDTFLAFLNVVPARLPLGCTLEDLDGGIDVPATLTAGRLVRRAGLLERNRRQWVVAENVDLLEPAVVAALCRHVDDGGRLLASTASAEEVLPVLRERLPLRLTLDATSPELSRERLQRLWQRDRDPDGFLDQWRPADDALRRTLTRAAGLVRGQALDPAILDALHRLAFDHGIEGAAAPLAACRVARAHAALRGGALVDEQDARFAAVVVYGIDEGREDEPARETDATRDAAAPPEQKADERDAPRTAAQARDADGAGEEGGAPSETPREGGSPERVESPQQTTVPELLETLRRWRGRGPTGRRGRAPSWERGRPARTVEARGRRGRIALIPTLRRAVLQRATRASSSRTLIPIRGEDLMIRRFERKLGMLCVFVVDASGSMARNRIRAAKGAVVGLLADAYIHRDQVAVIAARGEAAELVVPPTSSVARARALLTALPTGGGTPLGDALAAAHRLAHTQRGGERPVVVVVLTDGRANVAATGRSVDDELRTIGARFQRDGLPTFVLDTRPLHDRRDDAARLARWFGATYRRLVVDRPGPHVGNAARSL